MILVVALYLNVYQPGGDEYSVHGHYDITITSSKVVDYKYNGKDQPHVAALTFSYGYNTKNDLSGRVRIYIAESSYTDQSLPDNRFLIYDDISQEELNVFIDWMTEIVFDGGPSPEDYGWSFKVNVSLVSILMKGIIDAIAVLVHCTSFLAFAE